MVYGMVWYSMAYIKTITIHNTKPKPYTQYNKPYHTITNIQTNITKHTLSCTQTIQVTCLLLLSPGNARKHLTVNVHADDGTHAAKQARKTAVLVMGVVFQCVMISFTSIPAMCAGLSGTTLVTMTHWGWWNSPELASMGVTSVWSVSSSPFVLCCVVLCCCV